MTVPILFLHGFPFNGSLWKPQIEFFQDKSIVLAPDLRGHGSGPKGEAPWMILDYVEDLHELLVKAKIKEVTLCGHSMGGYVALEFIHHYPDMVKRLVLVSTRADADSNDAKDQRHKTIERIRNEGLEGFANDFSKSVLGTGRKDQKVELANKVKEMILSNSPEDVAMVIGAIASRKDSTSYLKDISCPTMVIAGSDDKVITWGVSHSMARRITNCRFSKIHHAGHLVSLEQPEKFNALLDTFINYQTLDLKELSDGYTSNATTIQH